jgi:hypothetical protein
LSLLSPSLPKYVTSQKVRVKSKKAGPMFLIVAIANLHRKPDYRKDRIKIGGNMNNKLTTFGINVWRDREEIPNSKIITKNENLCMLLLCCVVLCCV